MLSCKPPVQKRFSRDHVLKSDYRLKALDKQSAEGNVGTEQLCNDIH